MHVVNFYSTLVNLSHNYLIYRVITAYSLPPFLLLGQSFGILQGF